MDDRSERNLAGVHPDLVRLIRAAFVEWSADGLNSFIVTEGLRTKERQAQVFAAGASMTMNSRHLTGHAVDLACKLAGEVRWDWPLYIRLGEMVKALAKKMGIPIVWGGDWQRLQDGPHFELDRKAYP